MTKQDLSLNSSQTYTMRELNQRTADVMREINESGRPAAITRRGRIIAVITPMANANVEAIALEAVIAAAENDSQLVGERTITKAETPEAVADALDVNWRPNRTW